MAQVQITFHYKEPDDTLDSLVVTREWDGTLEDVPGRSVPTAVSGVRGSPISPHDGVLVLPERIMLVEWVILE